MTPEKLATTMIVTNETLIDGIGMREWMTIAAVAGRHDRGRYRRVWDAGYMAALEDIRAGRLRLELHPMGADLPPVFDGPDPFMVELSEAGL